MEQTNGGLKMMGILMMNYKSSIFYCVQRIWICAGLSNLKKVKMSNSTEILLHRIHTQATRKSRASNVKHLLEGDLEIIEEIATKALENLASSSSVMSESENMANFVSSTPEIAKAYLKWEGVTDQELKDGVEECKKMIEGIKNKTTNKRTAVCDHPKGKLTKYHDFAYRCECGWIGEVAD